MVAHEKRNSAQLFWAVPTQNNLALSFLFFHRPTHRKVGIAPTVSASFPQEFSQGEYAVFRKFSLHFARRSDIVALL